MSNNEKIDEKFISLLKAKIANYSQSTPTIAEEGKVISVTDGIAIVIGLNNIMLNEVVEFENGSLGIALNLEAQSVGIIILGKFHDISENSKVKRLNKVASIPVGDNLIGRIINPIGNVLDGKNKFGNTDK
jgi:F-type H+-transporting ATPase subunit alpha